LFERHRWIVALVVVVITAVAVTALPNLRTSDNFFAMFTARDRDRPLAEDAGVLVNNNPCLI
jgi:predicted RND superfamily exporter protein